MSARRPRLQIRPNIKPSPKSASVPTAKTKSPAESSFSEPKSPVKVSESQTVTTETCITLSPSTHGAGDMTVKGTANKSPRKNVEPDSDCFILDNKHGKEKKSSLGDGGEESSNQRRPRLNIKPNIKPVVKTGPPSSPRTAAPISNKISSPVSQLSSPRKSVEESDNVTSPEKRAVKSPRKIVDSSPESTASKKSKNEEVSANIKKDTPSQRRSRVNIKPNIRPSVKAGSASVHKSNPVTAVSTASETVSPEKAPQSEHSGVDDCDLPDLVMTPVSEVRTVKSPRKSAESINDSPAVDERQDSLKNFSSSRDEVKSSQRRPRFNIKPNIRPSARIGSTATPKTKSSTTTSSATLPASSREEETSNERCVASLTNDDESAPAAAERDGGPVHTSLDTPLSGNNLEKPTDTNDSSKMINHRQLSTSLEVVSSSPHSPAVAPDEVFVPPSLRATATSKGASKSEEVVSLASDDVCDETSSIMSEAPSLDAAEEKKKGLEEEAPVKEKKVIRRKRKQLPESVTSSLSPDRQKMKMGDLVFWNPQHNFFPKKNKPPVKKEETKKTVPDPDDLKDDSTNESAALPAPQIMIGPDGNIILNTESLIIRNEKKEPIDPKDIVEEDAEDRYLNYATYRKTKKASRWNEKESSMFFLGLSMCGTDFSLLTRLMPHRSRRDLKNKFRREEKGNRPSVDKALATRKKYDPTPFLNIEEDIKEKPKPKPEKKPRVKKEAKIVKKEKEVKTSKKDGAAVKPEKKKRQKRKRVKKKKSQSQIMMMKTSGSQVEKIQPPRLMLRHLLKLI